MASNHLNQNGDCSDNTHVETLPLPDSNGFEEVEVSPRIPSDSRDKFGVPEIVPRIGDEYQVEIPQLIARSDYISHPINCMDASRADHHEKFLIGLPILLTWISNVKCENLGITTEEQISKCGGRGYLLAPGLLDVCWSRIEKDSFLLGLYIFKKNFVEVRRFVGTKEMGDLLSFYHGKFYSSREYRRWSQCRKMKSKKCIYGQKIFSGARQQELLSRISRRVSEECQNALLEVSKAFGDEKMSLADYVSSLKAMVGTNILVEAVGIGKGKQDLTGTALEPSRSNQVVTRMRREMPTSDECSSLTTIEIIKFLSGDYRLSKQLSSDLFWEAVWPRLLARGWHSEKNPLYFVGSNNGLVFLVPGVSEFSRELVKGDHYFDSLTDVLSRVAKEPGLIELDNEEDDGGEKKEENGWSNEGKSGRDDVDVAIRQRRYYLQPKTAAKHSSTVVLKFTVVDTSLCGGKVRELRSLPSGIPNAFEEDSNKAKSDEKTLPGAHQGKNHQSRKVSKSNSSRKLKEGDADYRGPATKRQQVLSACNQQEQTKDALLSSKLDNGMSSCSSCIQEEVTETSQAGLCRDKSSSASSSRDSPDESAEKNTQSRELIDLNLPHVSPDSDETEPNKGQDSEDQSSAGPTAANEAIPEEEEQPNLNTRRHSRRNSTPTLRSLQAHAHGYLGVTRRRKGNEDIASSSSSRPSKRARGGVAGPANESTSSSVASQSEEGEGGNGSSSSGNGAFVQENRESASGQ